MDEKKQEKKANVQGYMPAPETVLKELSSAESMDDFFGKEGIFARLFAKTMEALLEAEMTEHLGYERYEAKGRKSGNSRNGHSKKKLQSSAGGDVEVAVPRDRKSEFEPQIIRKYETSSSELEDKILGMYAKGMSTRDISAMLQELYGIEVSAQTISNITDKVLPLVEAWQSRPLATIYPIIYLDALYFNLKKEHKVENRAVYVVLGLDLEGRKDVLGHWIRKRSEEMGKKVSAEATVKDIRRQTRRQHNARKKSVSYWKDCGAKRPSRGKCQPSPAIAV